MSRLDGISVHSYHYAAPGMYDPRLLDGVRRQYTAMAGSTWLPPTRPPGTARPTFGSAFHNMRATGAVVLFQSPTNLNLIAFSRQSQALWISCICAGISAFHIPRATTSFLRLDQPPASRRLRPDTNRR